MLTGSSLVGRRRVMDLLEALPPQRCLCETVTEWQEHKHVPPWAWHFTLINHWIPAQLADTVNKIDAVIKMTVSSHRRTMHIVTFHKKRFISLPGFNGLGQTVSLTAQWKLLLVFDHAHLDRQMWVVVKMYEKESLHRFLSCGILCHGLKAGSASSQESECLETTLCDKGKWTWTAWRSKAVAVDLALLDIPWPGCPIICTEISLDLCMQFVEWEQIAARNLMNSR